MEKITEYEINPQDDFRFGFRELWNSRELLYFFVWRDVKIKYKQTYLGIGWAILQPALMMIIFTLILGNKFKDDLGSVPYPIFLLSGFVVWNIFSNAVSTSGNSMVSNANIIKKVYFPRIIIPLSSVLSALVDFTFSLVLYALFLFFYEIDIYYPGILFIPLSLLLVIIASVGIGTLFSSLNILFRDFRYILPFVIQIFLFISPVFFPIGQTLQRFDYFFALNPIYGCVEVFRIHLSGYPLRPELVLISTISAVVMFLIGITVFKKTERHFADLA